MCVIAPSFADIFKNNTFQNGILPVTLSEDECQQLADDAEQGLELEVDYAEADAGPALDEPAAGFRRETGFSTGADSAACPADGIPDLTGKPNDSRADG